jgi:hypothetical protein
LFYFVPGEPPTGGLQLSPSRHHAESCPEELYVSRHSRPDNPEWFDGFFTHPGLGSGIDDVFGPGAGAVRSANRATLVHGDIPDPAGLEYLRDSVGVVSAVLEQGGLGVLDLYAARWWSKEEWLRRFVERSEFAVEDFVQFISSDDDLRHPGVWVHTRGLRKFGRPDLQIKHVSGPWAKDNPKLRAAGRVLNIVAEYLCRGAVVEDRQTMSFPNASRWCTFLLTPDDSDSEACHFGNEVLEVVDLVKESPGTNLNRLLREIAG